MKQGNLSFKEFNKSVKRYLLDKQNTIRIIELFELIDLGLDVMIHDFKYVHICKRFYT